MNLPQFTGTFLLGYPNRQVAEKGQRSLTRAAKPEQTAVVLKDRGEGSTCLKGLDPHVLIVTNNDVGKDGDVLKWVHQTGGSASYLSKPVLIPKYHETLDLRDVLSGSYPSSYLEDPPRGKESSHTVSRHDEEWK